MLVEIKILAWDRHKCVVVLIKMVHIFNALGQVKVYVEDIKTVYESYSLQMATRQYPRLIQLLFISTCNDHPRELLLWETPIEMTRTAPIRKYSADLTEDRYNIYKCYEEVLENTKGVFRSRTSKDRQSSSQKKNG